RAMAVAPDPPDRGSEPRANDERRDHAMRRRPTGSWRGLLAPLSAALLLALPPAARAEERSMRFRPVPPESAAGLEQPRRAEREAEEIPDTTAESGSEAIPPPPVPPEPEKPEKPETRTTSGDIVRFGSDITVHRGQLIEGDVVSFGGNIEV